jgi:hypothetical protein
MPKNTHDTNVITQGGIPAYSQKHNPTYDLMDWINRGLARHNTTVGTAWQRLPDPSQALDSWVGVSRTSARASAAGLDLVEGTNRNRWNAALRDGLPIHSEKASCHCLRCLRANYGVHYCPKSGAISNSSAEADSYI